MVFTQYADTMDFLRRVLRERGGSRVLCFSGRGGEVPAAGRPDAWRVIDHEQVKRRFRDGEADLLLCTDAASEGLNFQFCGALVNYDMPWNPMRVEQRIGRIDRVGQRHAAIRVVNLHYEGTVETAVYRALRRRIGLFEQFLGTPAADSHRDAEGHRRRSARRPRDRRLPSPTASSSGPPPTSSAVSTSTPRSTPSSQNRNARRPRSRSTISTACSPTRT